MKIKIALLLLMIASLSAKSEEVVNFDLDYCIDSASHIFRAKIINEKGLLEINQVFYGETKVKNISLPDFIDLKKLYPDLVPSDDFANWEVMVFLKKMNPSSQNIIPAFDLSKTSFDLALSIFWIKNNTVYYTWQASSYYPAVFSEKGTLQRFEKIMQKHIQVKTEVKRIEKKKRCKRKRKLFSRLFNQKEYQEKIYDAVLRMDCEKEILQFIETHLSDYNYEFVDKRMIRDYVKFGKEKYKHIKNMEAIFESEFSYWKNYIQTNPNKKWWKENEAMKNRLYYFHILTKAILREEAGNWRENTTRVFDFFSALEKYQNDRRENTINQQIERIRAEKENY